MVEPKIREFELHRRVTEREYNGRVLIVMTAEDGVRSHFVVAGYRRTENYKNEEGREAVMVEIISDPEKQKIIRDELLKDTIPREAMEKRAESLYSNFAERKSVLEEEIERYKNKHVIFFY